MAVQARMVSPDGREWLAGSVTEINDLLAQGYRFKGTAPAGPGLTSGTERPDNAPSPVANPAPITNTGQVAPAGDGRHS